MFDLGVAQELEPETVQVQEEPALEIALPQVFEQPRLMTLQRGKLPHVEALVARILRQHQEHSEEPLGEDYQELVHEFQPLFAWAIACWDYVLTTEGCRFLPRNSRNKLGMRGDYVALDDGDYSRLVHRVFRACVLGFAQAPSEPCLNRWLRERFWPMVLETYRRLENPPDPRQRILTPYSYLRCVPYAFLNDVHQELVYTTAKGLPPLEWQAIDAYFLHFFTEATSAQTIGTSIEEWAQRLRQGLTTLLIHHRLVYCLLRQIERY
jgi:hypothetical protein